MIFAEQALLGQDWVSDVRLGITNGRISSLETGASAQPGDTRVKALLPALSNLHSHSFQRAMAGLTERRAAGRDSFWTWRDLMYRFMDHLAPDDIETIAALAFMEMQEAGFAAVGEFHYVHHQPGGQAYDNIAELSERIFAAAALTGIGLTHLPVLYSYGGAGMQPLAQGQRRFGNDVERFADLVSKAQTGLTVLPHDAALGIAPHSLRATCPDDLRALLAMNLPGPRHIHIAEQPKEVADVRAWLGARPVEWALDNLPLGPDWCLIHATHMTPDETARLAATGAVAGLCPVTEANLGDGPFNGPGWLAAAGAFGVGSDSNVRISMVEELRTLEYSQRLRDMERNVLVAGEGSVGHHLYTAAAKGGAQALGRQAGEIALGLWADLLAIDTDHPTLCPLPPDRWLDGLTFAAGQSALTDLWSAGRHQVQQGRHRQRDGILVRWRGLAQRLRAVM
ncbi:formimidoylglutamate deiminase [Neogemmobacter tilapiae]|uniref:Formimidoylglutamate deiminase n=1 Tax=Neogemmobacter tilapiae TaxID=875041 RepID=A0A918TJM1_9RHOB|nr:formimidoylglutamate deiminase [Gemmobacter tilapiae]GHC50667.1 formimidoylglutamate deiminase [Gemmobacter tilapiae]